MICAWNEAPRVGAVVRVAAAAPGLSRVTVVDDGSADDTAGAAAAAGAEVLRLPVNGGKGAALAAGVRAALGRGAGVVLLLDADLVGLTLGHVATLLGPVVEGRAVMRCGLVDHGPLGNPIHRALPCLSGQRAVAAEVFGRVAPGLAGGYRVEVGLNHAATCAGAWDVVTLPGLGAHGKAAKEAGGAEGGVRHARMLREVLLAWGESARTACVVRGGDGGR